jgi:prolyl oligopeptidase
MKIPLLVEALFYLLQTEYALRRHKRRPLQQMLRDSALGSVRRKRSSAQQICHAMDIACLLYFKVVLCLQRSVAVTMLLRRYGFKAELVVGTQIAFSRFHAWVELNDLVLNDKPYMPQLFQELERC